MSRMERRKEGRGGGRRVKDERISRKKGRISRKEGRKGVKEGRKDI